MDALIKRDIFLPDTIEDLRDFVLIGTERLKAQRAKIQAIEKVGMAETAQKAAIRDAQDAGQIIIMAEARLGELIEAAGGQSYPKGTLPKGGSISNLPAGITKKLSHQAQTIAKNPERVERIIEQAIIRETIPTPDYVYKKIKKEQKIGIPKSHQIPKKSSITTKELISEEFENAFRLFHEAIRNANIDKFQTTSKEAIYRHMAILNDFVNKL